MATYLSIAGLVLNLLGVIVLFLFGMPFRLRTDGKSNVTVMRASWQDDIEKDRLYTGLGWCGLVLIIVGTGLQIWAALPQTY